MCARDQCSIFSTVQSFRPDYGLLLELHALTLVAHSYVLLSAHMHTSAHVVVKLVGDDIVRGQSLKSSHSSVCKPSYLMSAYYTTITN